MVGNVIGEKEQRPGPTHCWTGALSIATETVRGAAMKPSFWFAAAMLAGISSIAFAAYEGSAPHDGCLAYGRY